MCENAQDSIKIICLNKNEENIDILKKSISLKNHNTIMRC